MKRGAKPLVIPDVVAEPLDGELLHARRLEIAVMNERHQEVLARFGDGGPYVRASYMSDIQHHGRRSIESMLVIGRRLLVMKELEPHGEWLPLLAEAGIDDRYARRVMEGARRVALLPNRVTSPDLAEQVNTQSKFFELLSLPEDEFSLLLTSGEGGGVTLDEVERMGTRELRAALRKARGALQDKEEALQETSENFRRAREDVSRMRRTLPLRKADETADAMVVEVGALAISCRQKLTELHDGFAALIAHATANNLDYSDDLARLTSGVVDGFSHVVLLLRNEGVTKPASDIAFAFGSPS